MENRTIRDAQTRERSQLPRAAVGYSRFLGPRWIAESVDAAHAWEPPRHSVEVNVPDAVAQELLQKGDKYIYGQAGYIDVLGRMNWVLGVAESRSLTLIAVPVQSLAGWIWFEESALYGCYALKVRSPRHARGANMYLDNMKARLRTARFNNAFNEVRNLPRDERQLPCGQFERMVDDICARIGKSYASSSLQSAHFFMPCDVTI